MKIVRLESRARSFSRWQKFEKENKIEKSGDARLFFLSSFFFERCNNAISEDGKVMVHGGK